MRSTLIGQVVAHYRILEKLGEGGMGEVYLAEDTSLSRRVALKFLPPGLVENELAHKRFLREAQSAAALNHPYICTIHEVSKTQEGQDVIVMEYVEGQTLKDRMDLEPLSFSMAIQIAVEIAEALDEAHSKGIIHRDLKPANIMLTKGGHAKVMDFGLAKKVVDTQGAGHDISSTLTREGSTVGTLAYMSPEQVRGLDLDARSDIFSFGVLLFELLEGVHPFRRATPTGTISAILTEDSKALSLTDQDVSPFLPLIIEKALRKSPDERYQTIRELKADLSRLSKSIQPTATKSPPRLIGLLAGLGILAVLLLVASYWWWEQQREAAPALLNVSRFSVDAGLTTFPALSSDGNFVAYASDRHSAGGLDVYVQQVTGAQAIRLTEHPEDDSQPSFSPDGAQIAFHSRRNGENGIYLVNALGGTPRKLLEPGKAPKFSPTEQLLAYIEPHSYRVMLTSVQGGAPRYLNSEYRVMWQHETTGVVWSGDGRYILFNGYWDQDPTNLAWYVFPVDGGSVISLNTAQYFEQPRVNLPVAWKSDAVYVCYGMTMDGVNLYRVRISLEDEELLEEPQKLTSVTEVIMGAALSSSNQVIFPVLELSVRLKALSLDDFREESPLLESLSLDSRPRLFVTSASDGSRFAFASFASFERFAPEVTLIDRRNGRTFAIPLSRDPFVGNPRLSTDGSLLTYGDWKDGKLTSFLASSEGAVVREVCRDCRVLDFTQGNSAVVLSRGTELIRESLETGQQETILESSDSRIVDADVSLDDRWLLFLLRGSGGNSLYAAPFGKFPIPRSEWIPVIEDSAFLLSPRFSSDGERIFFISDRDGGGCVWMYELYPETRHPLGDPIAVHHAHSGRFRLDTPPGWGQLAVTDKELLFFLIEVRGNLFLSEL